MPLRWFSVRGRCVRSPDGKTPDRPRSCQLQAGRRRGPVRGLRTPQDATTRARAMDSRPRARAGPRRRAGPGPQLGLGGRFHVEHPVGRLAASSGSVGPAVPRRRPPEKSVKLNLTLAPDLARRFGVHAEMMGLSKCGLFAELVGAGFKRLRGQRPRASPRRAAGQGECGVTRKRPLRVIRSGLFLLIVMP